MFFPPSSCEVVIVGGGVAGCSAAIHLVRAGVRNIVLLEAGSPGDGVAGGSKVPEHAFLTPNDTDECGEYAYAFKSGSAVLDDPVGTIKMIVNLYPSKTEDFCSHHGEEGAKRYLSLAHEGIAIQKSLAQEALQNGAAHIRSLGSLYVAEEADRDALRNEFESLQRLGCIGVEWLEGEEVRARAGGQAGFVAGIYFPHDAIINSAQYCKDLLQLAMAESERIVGRQDSLKIYTGMSVTNVDFTSDPDHAYTTLHGGIRVRSKFVILATGGLNVDPSLAGVLTPCWSYLVGIADPRVSPTADLPSPPGADTTPLQYPHSPNLFTWGFTHDWCMTAGHLRISGEDHYSALKPPRMQQRCASLAKWTIDKYPYLSGNNEGGLPEFVERYGVYSETPDSVPLVGQPYRGARVCYLLGCNAWGQASLSYAASLVPGILGYQSLSPSQKDHLKLLTVRRFAMLPVVRNGANDK